MIGDPCGRMRTNRTAGKSSFEPIRDSRSVGSCRTHLPSLLRKSPPFLVRPNFRLVELALRAGLSPGNKAGGEQHAEINQRSDAYHFDGEIDSCRGVLIAAVILLNPFLIAARLRKLDQAQFKLK